MSSLEFLKSTQEKYKNEMKARSRIILCAGTGCVASGAMKIYAEFEKQIQAQGLKVALELKYETKPTEGTLVSKSGCQGFCQMGPLVSIEPAGVFYVKVQLSDVAEIVEKTLKNGEAIERLLYRNANTGATCKAMNDIPFYAKQDRRVLGPCGAIDPEDLNEYIGIGGYSAAYKAIVEMTPEQVCSEVSQSGLRGRGGGGFPTGRKWELTLKQPGPVKYVICNGDEGDPGAFMDRSVMEGNPHSVLEGMLIAGRAIGACEGYVYVRAEYPLAVARVRKAAIDAEKAGLLGDKLFGSDFNFKIKVMEGAGAFVCGEETALIASIEGERGMPRSKPPFPAQSGLYKKPTVINNVETLSSVPRIITQGFAAYRSVGTQGSPGTKTFALTGHVANTGLIEVPFGATIRQIMFDIGGGITGKDGKVAEKNFKAVQIGGPSGACLTRDHLDMPLDFDSLTGIGAMVGSGGLVAMNQDTCMVQMARFFMQFTQNESCGKCVLCREGTKQMLNLLDDIIEGRGTQETVDLLLELGRTVKLGSLCGLGKSAPNPVLSTLKNFKEEIEQHVVHKRCPTGQCKALSSYSIIPEKCKGCTICAKKCPVNAITGEVKKPHVIDDVKCIKCGVCATVCKFSAVTV